MQFQVPQFIETEDKIIGPLTLKQFLFLAAAGGLSFMFFFLLQTWLWLVLTLIFGSVAAALAFIKVNGRPLPTMAMSAFSYYWKPRFYLWKKTELSSQSSEDIYKLPSFEGLSQQVATNVMPVEKRESAARPPAAARPFAQGSFEILKKITGEREVAKRVDYR